VSEDFEPKILGFLCNWCSYAGADLAGVSRIQYPANTKIIRVMCSTRVDPVLVVEGLMAGIDGVLITGCHLGDCHYQTGNYQTQRRFDALLEALSHTSMGNGRIRLEWVSASEGARFSEVITQFTEQIRQLGPNPANSSNGSGKDCMTELLAIKRLFETHSTRTLIGKKGEVIEEGNVYGEKLDLEEYNDLISKNVENEYIRSYIIVHSKSKSRTIKEYADKLRLPTRRIVPEISFLMRKNMLALESMDGTTPKFQSLVQEGDA